MDKTKKPRGSKPSLLEIVVVLFFVYVLAAMTVLPSCQRIEPPSPNSTIKEFAELMPEPQSLWLDEATGYIVWRGPLKYPVASGRSLYIFDENQKLIDWRAVTGEGEIIKGFSGFNGTREISLQEALIRNPD